MTYFKNYTGVRNVMFLTLGDIVESIAWEGSTKDKIETARQQIFNFEYPFWNEEHKKSFETLFIRHFYFNEIAQETEGRFFFELENWLLTNMEFYRKRLASQIWEEKITNPLANYEVFENVSNATSREEVEQILQALERLQSDVGELTKNTNESSSGTYDNTKTIADTLANDEEITNTVTDTVQKTTSQEKTASTNETATENETGEKTGALNEQASENENEQKTAAVNEQATESENAQKVSAGNGVTEKDVQSNTDKTVNEDETNTDFKRELVSNTPQTRLQITTGVDGTGVIEHASTIQEDRDKRVRDTSQVANETANGTENERTTESNTENVAGDKEVSKTGATTENATADKSLSKTSATSENERLTKDVVKDVTDNEQVTSTETDTQTRTETNTLSQDKTQTITDTDAQTTSNTQTGSEQQDTSNTQNVDETQNIDKNVSTKETQNMASHKYGSIGVQTYDQLLNGYRTIFMRVEKEMLDDMHNELFMLVY